MGCLTFTAGAMVGRMRTAMATPRVDVMRVHFAYNVFTLKLTYFLLFNKRFIPSKGVENEK